ncbi:hypothetical protein IEQ34_008552 [Dendrobium chrysotoxum]|uniref:Globin family profile domain-containing protein n=1 Tax=Dendrobium chrysotoxum TaxID=161865 RepID=A0AAV7GWW6_DENCH|nr:hypothetical protein IEQ34_008552 [Dendrobium chrysotoxum]
MSQLSILVSGSDSEEEAHVLKLWNAMKKDVATLGLKFFLRIFEIAPSAAKLFSFRDTHKFHLRRTPSSNLLTPPNYLPHSCIVHDHYCFIKIIVAITDIITWKVIVTETTLKKIGNRHVKYGVLDEHFEVTRFTLLETINHAIEIKRNLDFCSPNHFATFIKIIQIEVGQGKAEDQECESDHVSPVCGEEFYFCYVSHSFVEYFCIMIAADTKTLITALEMKLLHGTILILFLFWIENAKAKMMMMMMMIK